jgi:hypothetical protein
VLVNFRSLDKGRRSNTGLGSKPAPSLDLLADPCATRTRPIPRQRKISTKSTQAFSAEKTKIAMDPPATQYKP